MINTAIYSIVSNTVLSSANAKLFNITDPKRGAIIGFSFSLITLVALRVLQELMESLKHNLDKNLKSILGLLGLTLVYFTGVYGAKWVADQNGYSLTTEQIHKLNLINFVVSLLILNLVKRT